MATTEGENPDARRIDQVIAFFNARRMDLPDGFFDRKTQFLINGAPFETLLGQSPTDPLILMLTRGSAGFRFTAKALQHAIPDARVDAAFDSAGSTHRAGVAQGNRTVSCLVQVAAVGNAEEYR